MEEKIKEFKEYWAIHYPHVPMIMDDEMIIDYIPGWEPIKLAVKIAVEDVLAQGLGWVKE